MRDILLTAAGSVVFAVGSWIEPEVGDWISTGVQVAGVVMIGVGLSRLVEKIGRRYT